MRAQSQNDRHDIIYFTYTVFEMNCIPFLMHAAAVKRIFYFFR